MDKTFYRQRMQEVGASKFLRKLHKRLLTLGGEWVVPLEENIQITRELLKRGELVIPTSKRAIKLIKGEPNQCHANASSLWLSDDDYTLFTGYALDNDGLWRQHTWTTKNGSIVETTYKFKAYYGISITGLFAMEFSIRANAHKEHKQLAKLTTSRAVLLRKIISDLQEQLALSS